MEAEVYTLPEQSPLDFELQHELRELFNLVIEDPLPVDWEAIRTRLFIDPRFFSVNRSLSHISGLAAEIQFQLVLEQLSLLRPRVLDLNPLDVDVVGENYVLRKTPKGAIYCHAGDTGRTLSEVDALFTYKNIPVIAEVKLADSMRSKGSRSSPSSRGVNYAISSQRISFLTTPIKECFRSQSCGFVVAVPKDLIDPDHYPLQREYLRQGGLFIPICESKDLFEKQALQTFLS